MRVGILDLQSVWEENTVEQLLPLVSEERKKQICKAARWEDRLRSLAGEYLLREMLAAALQPANSFPLRFDYSSQGKPVLVDFPGVHFSLSHSGTMAACVVAEHPVGIDVQKFAGIREKISRRCYTPKEQNYWKTAENPEKAFYQLWSLKESFVKMLGAGLAFPFQNVEFICKQSISDVFADFSVHTEDADGDTEKFTINKDISSRVFETGRDYSLAVCVSEGELISDMLEPIFVTK